MFVPILILTHPSALFPLEAVKRKAALKYSPRPTDPSIIISSLLDTEMVSDYNFRIVLDSHSIILQYCHVSLKMQKRKSNKTPYFPHPPPTHTSRIRDKENTWTGKQNLGHFPQHPWAYEIKWWIKSYKKANTVNALVSYYQSDNNVCYTKTEKIQWVTRFKSLWISQEFVNKKTKIKGNNYSLSWTLNGLSQVLPEAMEDSLPTLTKEKGAAVFPPTFSFLLPHTTLSSNKRGSIYRQIISEPRCLVPYPAPERPTVTGEEWHQKSISKLAKAIQWRMGSLKNGARRNG